MGLNRMSTTSRCKAFQGWQSPYEITSVLLREVEAVHKATTENAYKQHLVEVEGQSDILTGFARFVLIIGKNITEP